MTVERRLPFEHDPVAVAAALASASTEPHVVYENHGAVTWAEGEHATISVDAAGSLLTEGGRQRLFPADGRPLGSVTAAMGAVTAPVRRLHGWAGFELSHLLHGQEPPARHGPLAYLAVPSREILLDGRDAVLRAATEPDLDLLHRRLLDAAGYAAEHDAPAAGRIEVDLRADAPGYLAAVGSAVADIRAGLLDKVILSRVVEVPGDIDLPATYLAGRRGNDPARSFLFRLGGWEAAGFSPEIVVGVDAGGAVRTQPLAGTRAFENDPSVDGARRGELYRDAKEVFEHAISVRLAADELAGVCAPDTVRIDDFMSVKERGSVQHLASDVTGRLDAEHTPWDAFATLFPAVTASGIPKSEACRRIRDAEGEPRGLYSGAVLSVGPDGTMDAALVLRTVFRRDGRTWLRAGAGVVAQSTPERELEETVEKLRSVSRFLVPAGSTVSAGAAGAAGSTVANGSAAPRVPAAAS
ncbi:salicylate synthase [Pseudonocardia sp. HH130630-07]|uniref:salicylate synthase n=1 Tax=Pseudonocardia sp. HH130630-07 TaxID=1690815 RepID=UPI000839B51B|nr:salicylate synthase [Pseudonocardia sp. HH130630-07]